MLVAVPVAAVELPIPGARTEETGVAELVGVATVAVETGLVF